jgi:hypothetical protein
MLQCLKGIFGADHVPMVSCTIKIEKKKFLISLIIGSSEGGFRLKDERKFAVKIYVKYSMNEEKNDWRMKPD